MPEPKLRFFFREPNVDTNRPLRDGTVAIEGFELEVVDDLENADAWDCAFALRILSHARGGDDVSIPAFPNRKFRHSYIAVNANAGIRRLAILRASASRFPVGQYCRNMGTRGFATLLWR